jgi:hypothetical protein
MDITAHLIGTDTIEIGLGGKIDIREVRKINGDKEIKNDVNGVYDRIIRKTAENPRYKKLILDMLNLRYAHHGLVDAIERLQDELKKEDRELEIINVYGQPAVPLDKFGIKYRNIDSRIEDIFLYE